KVVIDVRPEHRSDPADGKTAPPPRPGRTKESAVEPGKPEARLECRVGDSAIGKYPATGSGYARASKVISREACPCDARPRRRHGPPGEMAASERSNAATADTPAADRTSDKAPTPTPGPQTPSAYSPLPTRATPSSP